MTESGGLGEWVQKRLRFLARHREREPRFEGRELQGSGPQNRHGAPTVPVGQHVVKNWPVLDLGDVPDVSRDAWRLELAGLVARPTVLDWAAFEALEQVDDVSDFHCVTSWSRLDNRWRGVRFATLAALAQPDERARFVAVTAYDREPGTGEPYTTNLPLARALEDDVLLVHSWDGRPLPREHGGPVRMITPKLYAWKGAKWIAKIEFL
ncbi:MAG: molybdopterin-dependent oxidoreductase, partial [Planctomycetes bacterium]|nr:molybdopterin-dependent oxidoreductase [Planctomycetota bacterium]